MRRDAGKPRSAALENCSEPDCLKRGGNQKLPQLVGEETLSWDGREKHLLSHSLKGKYMKMKNFEFEL